MYCQILHTPYSSPNELYLLHFFSDNHDILSVKFYELGSDVDEDPEQFLNVEPKAEGAEAERGIIHLSVFLIQLDIWSVPKTSDVPFSIEMRKLNNNSFFPSTEWFYYKIQFFLVDDFYNLLYCRFDLSDGVL